MIATSICSVDKVMIKVLDIHGLCLCTRMVLLRMTIQGTTDDKEEISSRKFRVGSLE